MQQESYKPEENEKREEDGSDVDSKMVVALNIDNFLEAILESPEKLKPQTVANITAIYSIFNLDEFLTSFFDHPCENLGNLMIELFKVNWNIIPSVEDYFPILIDNTFKESLSVSSFQTRLTTVSRIVKNDILQQKNWNDCFAVYQDHISKILFNKEAMIVFSLCCIHDEHYDIASLNAILMNDMLKQIYCYISSCDEYSELFFQCLEIIMKAANNKMQIIDLVDLESFIQIIFEKPNTKSLNTLVLWRIGEFPDEGIILLRNLTKFGIRFELQEALINIKENIGNFVLQLLKEYNISDIMNDEECRDVVYALLEALEDKESVALPLYSLLIENEVNDVILQCEFLEQCESLIDNLPEETVKEFEKEVKKIKEFVFDD